MTLPSLLRRRPHGLLAVGLIAAAGLLPALTAGETLKSAVSIASPAVGLGSAAPFAVLAGAGVTNTGPTLVNGDLGTCPTPAITGFPNGIVNGTIHANDAVACQAQSDLTIAYNDAAGRAPTTTYSGPTDLGGLTLTPGVYTSPTSLAITGTLTLNGQGDPDALFIFQAGSTLITAPNSQVLLVNGAEACNAFWQVGSSATLGVGSTFLGTLLALSAVTVSTGVLVHGRLLARNDAVTLDTDRVTKPTCTSSTTTTTTAPASSSTTTTTLPASSSTTTTTSPPPSTTTTTTSPPPSTTTTGPLLGTSTTTRPSNGSTTSTTAPSNGSTTSTTAPSNGSTTSTTAPSNGSTTSTTAPSNGSTTSTTGPSNGGTTSTTAVGTGGGAATAGPGSEVLGEVVARPASPVPATALPAAALPRTGAPLGTATFLGAIALALGAASTVLGRRKNAS